MQLKSRSIRAAATLLAITGLGLSTTSQAEEVSITVQNLQGSGGLYLTPFWVAFHNGQFDTYDSGSPASAALERIAEDGNAGPLSEAFLAAVPNGLDGVIVEPAGFPGAPVFDPGGRATQTFDLNPAEHKYFSYASMIIPSNDAFVSNANPLAHEIFDDEGNFTGPISFVIYGSQIRDAGTEVNSETEAAFLNQTGPDSGRSESRNISVHRGFNGSEGNPNSTPVNILGGITPAGTEIIPEVADFTRNSDGFPLARITISEPGVPVRLTIRNRSEQDGIFLTPFWVAFHQGDFDSYDGGQPSTPELERLAEDGTTAPISALFAATDPLGIDATVVDPEGFAGAPLFDPQSSESVLFTLNPANQRYFSYASMLIPSNDAFIANGNPRAHLVFDESGNFAGPINFTVFGSDVNDNGTEANTETDAAFFDQTAPDTGETTNDVITAHPGFNGSVGNPDGTPQRILGGTNGPGFFFDETAADFSIGGYKVAEISISQAVDGSFSGNWYNKDRNGEGFVIEVTETAGGSPRLVVSYYTYATDLSGDQVWLVGSGPIVGTTGIADVFMGEGARFGNFFDPNQANFQRWGQIEFEFHDCKTATVRYNSLIENFGSGEYAVQRLTRGPSDFIGACSE